MLSVFAELEREMIRERVLAGLARARKHGTRSGRSFGRPRGADYQDDAIRSALLEGKSVRETASATGASRGTVGNVRKALAQAGQLGA
jgi:DNA invertase Pin-like site-specific DNA recombinase